MDPFNPYSPFKFFAVLKINLACSSIYQTIIFYVVVNHSNDIVDPNMIDDSTLMFTITELTTIRETITESFTIYRTVINDLNCTPNPSPLQDTGSVTQDKNNTPIFIATSVVVVGLLLTLAIFIVGVILCHRHQKRKKSWIFSTREESE